MLRIGVLGAGHLGKFHLNNWKEIVKNLFDRIRSSGLYDKIDEVRYGFLGNPDCLKDEIFKDPKFHNILWSSDINLRETVTLNKLWYAVKEEESKLIFIFISKYIFYNLKLSQ